MSRATARPGLDRRRRQALSWAAVVIVVATALAIGTFQGRSPRTAAEREQSLAREIACPVCGGESVAQSNAPAAQNMRNSIAQMVDAGRTDDEIRTYLAQQFGDATLMRPKGEGLSTLVWAVPVVVAVVAVSGLVVVFRRWSAKGGPGPTPEDRELVARFLSAEDVGEVGGGVPERWAGDSSSAADEVGT
jgi:cytochrome c-type biogenesis protein CcmH